MADIYLDNNATTAVHPRVRQRIFEVLEMGPLNPSSSHRQGKLARSVLEAAREDSASIVGCRASQLFFTSGATEANHRVLDLLRHGKLEGYSLVTSSVEHSSILEAARALSGQGVSVTIVPVDADGVVDPAVIADAIAGPETLVSIQWANNETGVLQPIAEVSSIVRDRGALLHCDGVQAVGKTPVDVERLPVDFLVFSSHKLNGPQGAAALVARDPQILVPGLPGGGQERGVRPGTENLAAVAGFGLACTIRRVDLLAWMSEVVSLRDQFESRLRATGAVSAVNGGRVPRLCNTSNIRFASVDGEALSLRLQAAGLSCSQGSACNAQKPEPSYVLRAMGLNEDEAWASLRFSFSAANTHEEVVDATSLIQSLHKKMSSSVLARAV